MRSSQNPQLPEAAPPARRFLDGGACAGMPGSAGLANTVLGQPQSAAFDETRLRDRPGPGSGVVAALHLQPYHAAASQQLDNIFANVELLDGSRTKGADRPLGNCSEGVCLQRQSRQRSHGDFAGFGDTGKVPGLPSMLAGASSSLPSMPARALRQRASPSAAPESIHQSGPSR
jgi:hypothetical protein